MVGRLSACVLNMVQSSQACWQGGWLRQAAACHSRGVWTHMCMLSHSGVALQRKSCPACVLDAGQ